MAVSEHQFAEELPVKSALAVAVSTALTGYAHDATAQESGASSALEEIVVTSRKREESMQDISGSIQAMTGEQMKRQGLQNLEDQNTCTDHNPNHADEERKIQINSSDN